MRFYVLVVVTYVLQCSAPAFGQAELRVMSFNMRYDNPADSPNHWLARKEKVASQISFHEADIVGAQEMLHHQVEQLQAMLPGYAFVGAGRDDGKKGGEYSCIFYNQQVLELVEHNDFWLSLTPNVAGSKSWDAAITRMVTWARFRHKTTGKTFYHFNTHFDHVGKEARRQSATILLKKVAAIAGSTPAIVTGDFNAHPHDEPMQVIFDKASPLVLTDTRQLSASGHYGPQGTFNAFGPKETHDTPIDYVLVKGDWKVLKHATLSQSWQGRYASDHFAVYALLQIP